MIILSMSAIHTYLRCPKKFELRYVQGWEDFSLDKPALAEGTAVHAYLESSAKRSANMPFERLDWDTDMGRIAQTYMAYNPLPSGLCIKSVDDPHLLEVMDGVSLRTTFDLVYESADRQELRIRDYKTFERAPSLDIDLDFQARTYIWAATQLWPEYQRYAFEHEYIRRTLPHVKKDKAGNAWETADCYKKQSMILSASEVLDDGAELLDTMQEIVERVKSVRGFRRVPLKGGGYDQCASCSVKNLCIANKQKNLNTDSDYRALASKKDTIFDGLQ